MKKIAFLSLVLLVILIAGCAQQNMNAAITPIRHELSFSLWDCSAINITQRRDWCYYEISKEALGESTCDKISDNSEYKTDCQAIARKNISMCEGVSQLFCVPFVAISSNNISLCSGDSDLSHSCLAIFNSDLSECDKEKTDLSKVWCYYSVAVSTGDERICGLITGIPVDSTEVKDSAFSTKNLCFMNIAVERRNQTICDNIEIKYDSDRSNKNECLIESAGFQNTAAPVPPSSIELRILDANCYSGTNNLYSISVSLSNIGSSPSGEINIKAEKNGTTVGSCTIPNIKINGAKYCELTDNNGYGSLAIPNGYYNITISYNNTTNSIVNGVLCTNELYGH